MYLLHLSTQGDTMLASDFFVDKDFNGFLEDLISGAPVAFDFEISYTTNFFDTIIKNSNKVIINKHFLQQYGCKHTWVYSNEDDFDTSLKTQNTAEVLDVTAAQDDTSQVYNPQWQLGFYVRKRFFFVSNVEPYSETSKQFLDALRPYLSQVTLVGQNVKFDLGILCQIMELSEREILTLCVHDLMTLGYSRNLEHKRFNLHEAALRHLKTKSDGDKHFFDIDGELVAADWKHELDWHRTPLNTRFDETVKYNREDLLITDAIYHVLSKELHELGVLPRVHQIYTWFIPLYSLIEQNGLLIDPKVSSDTYYECSEAGLLSRAQILTDTARLLANLKANSKAAEKLRSAEFEKFKFFDHEAIELRSEVTTKVSKNFTIDLDLSNTVTINTISGSLFREFLSTITAEVFNFQLNRTKTGYAFQQDNIDEICQKLKVAKGEDSEILLNILTNMLEVNSLKANLARVYAFYLLPKGVYPDKRLHSDYKLTGTETGRLSSVRPGVMNLPMRIKKLIKGRKGFCQVDLRSAEAKLFMLFTQNAEILSELETNDDTYSVIGMRVFSLTEMSKKTRPIERNLMKIGVLAKMYGQDINGMAQQVELYYKPVRWEFALNPSKYAFAYDWECVSIPSDPKILDKIEYFKTAPKDELTDEILAELSDYVTLDYFTLAERCDKKLEDTIDSGVYEDWVCKTFVNFDNLEESMLISPAGLIRNFDMSENGLFFGFALESQEKTLLHKFLLTAYKTFFINGNSFDGEYFNGKEFIKIERRRLHAFSAFIKYLRFSLRKKEKVATSKYQKTSAADQAGLTEEERKHIIALFMSKNDSLLTATEIDEALIRLMHTSFLMTVLSKVAQRFAARYRESLNLPVQGMSSFLNSKIAYESYLACLDNNIDAKIVNTVHDANHFDLNFDIRTEDDTNLSPEYLEFRDVVQKVYSDVRHVKAMLEPGLRAIHPGKELRFIAIGGDDEPCRTLAEAK